MQVGADAEQRRRQAKLAYGICGEIDISKSYVLIDDVWTTGSSMMAAVNVLRSVGVKKIYGAVICRS